MAARKEAEQKRKEAEEKFKKEMEEIENGVKGIAAASTLEQSLDRALDAASDIETFDKMAEQLKDRHPNSNELWYLEEDQITDEYWVHGVEEPEMPEAKDGKLSAEQAKKLYQALAAWQSAFRQLEVRFIRRAVFAADLKSVYVAQRALRKKAEKAEETASASAKASEKKAEALTKASEVLLSYADKPCRCTTQCENRACGCKKAGKSCSSKCACKHVDCCNPSSYTDDDKGAAACGAAIAKWNKSQKAKGAQALKEAEAKAKSAAELVALRAENGLE